MQDSILHLVIVSVQALLDFQFIRLSLFLMTFTVLRPTGEVFCRMSPNWDLSDVFLIIQLGSEGFGEEDHRSKMPFSSKIHTLHMTSHLGYPAEVVFVSLLYYKPTLYFPLSLQYPLEGRLYAKPLFTEQRIILHLLQVESTYIMENSSIFFLCVCVCIYLIMYISVWTSGYLFYTLGYNPKLRYLFCCSKCSSFGVWELFQLTPMSLCQRPLHCVCGRGCIF